MFTIMETIRPYLLLSNDDGYEARGLLTLIEALQDDFDLLVVAPQGPRSGFACSITSGRPISARLIKEDTNLTIYACDGTPVDCVKLALNRYARRRPDLIVAGINHGDNSSVNSHYSGTMGAASEGALQGIPAVAFSLCDHDVDADFNPLRPYLVHIVHQALAAQMQPFTCWNVNFPRRKHFEGVSICRMARSRWEREIADCPDPWQRTSHYWLVGECTELEPEATDTDRWALRHGFVALTPTTLDNTDYQQLTSLEHKQFVPSSLQAK